MRKLFDNLLSLRSSPFDEVFQHDRSSRYFNTAGGGQVPASLSNAVRRLLAAYDENGAMSRNAVAVTKAVQDEARASLAHCFGAEQEGFALFDSATSALGAVAAAIDVAPGAKVLVGKDEHPSLEIPFLALERRGAQIVRVDASAAPETQEAPEEFSVCALSVTGYRTGENLHPAWRAHIKSAGALFVADATQSAGLIPLSVEDLACDVMVGNGHKWLHGALGTGFAYIKEEAMGRLHPAGGWRSINDPTNHRSLWRNARAFDGGTLSFPSIASLAVTCAWWADDVFRARLIEARQERAKAIIAPLLEKSALRIVHENPGFICISAPDDRQIDARALADAVWASGGFDIKPFSFSERPGGGCRISVSPFNNVEDCKELGEKLLSFEQTRIQDQNSFNRLRRL